MRAATFSGCGAIALWSTLGLLSRAAAALPPLQLTAMAFCVSAVLGLGLLAVRGELGVLRQPWPVWAHGIFGLFGFHAFYFAAPAWAQSLSRGRSLAVKPFIMDNAVVVGVGNIYASEALFAAGIDPRREAGSISRARYLRLGEEIKRILAYAIERGGTTLRDFVGGDGQPGYFQQELFVYGRGGEFCKTCGSTLREVKLGQRASVYCPRCQR